MRFDRVIRRVTCIYLNAQSRWPLRMWRFRCIMNYLKEIDKEKVYCTIDLVLDLSLHKNQSMQNQACFRFTREYIYFCYIGTLKNSGSGLSK